MTEPLTGAEPPYAAPLILRGGTVLGDWIDYNGHMNVAYYTLAFDRAIDQMLEEVLGVGESFVSAARQGPYALQSRVHYLGELLEGAAFDFTCRLVDCDAKRLHLFLELRDGDGAVAATCEQLLMNVDLVARRSVPYPAWAQARMAALCQAHGALDRPDQLGQPLHIRRR